ncbi:MAG: uroporphyrinogen decarboxylase/cobalamine-independent methonine synthase family protein [Bacillota bacterium]
MMMLLDGLCQTTAMGILPHTDIEQALKLALSLDIPFWPQLPRVSFYEDMYVQASEGFPGVSLDMQEKRIIFDMEAFYQDLELFVEHLDNLQYYRISEKYSPVYHRFLEQDLSSFKTIHGQCIGPVSFGLSVVDASKTPVIYKDEVRQLLYQFLAKKIEAQYADLSQKAPQAFVWIDDPGLELVFMAFTGYPSEKAKVDMLDFMKNLPGPKGVHLCGNPDWSFLLNLDLDILSLDALRWGHIFTRYTEEVVAFIQRGGIISWGIVPTLTEEMAEHGVEALLVQIEEFWDHLSRHGLNKRQIANQSWVAPARCCLLNGDGHQTVEQSFGVLKKVSRRLQEKYL